MKNMWTHSVRLIKKRMDRIAGIPDGISMLTGAAQPLLIILAITILSFLVVDIFYKVVTLQAASRQTSGMGQVSTARLPSDQGRSAEYYDVVHERNLFQTTLKAIVSEPTGEVLLPSEEYTAFDLKGTIAVDQSIGYVIVEEKGKGKQKLYRIGEMIGSARLVRITRNAAILESGGKEFVMKIRESVQGSLSDRSSGSGNGIAISKQEVMQSLADLKSIMSQALVRPFVNDGVPQGFIISNIVPGSLYQKLGLKNGDIIVDVNDKKLQGADDLLQLVNVMQSGGSISLNLMRNGKNETINYSFH